MVASLLKVYLILKCVSSPPNGLQASSRVAVMSYFGFPIISNTLPFVQQTLWKHLFTEDCGCLAYLQIILCPTNLSRSTDQFLAYLQTLFPPWALTVIIFLMGKWFQQMCFSLSLSSRLLLCQPKLGLSGKNKIFQENSTKAITIVTAHFQNELNIYRHEIYNSQNSWKISILIQLYAWLAIAILYIKRKAEPLILLQMACDMRV